MDFTVADIIREQAAARPDAPALTYESRTWSYGELDAASSRVANALLGAGVGPGDRVALLSKNTAEYFEVLFGCAKMGATVVGLNWRLAAPEIATIMSNAEPSLLLLANEQRDLVPGDASAATEVVMLGDEYEAWRDAADATDPGRRPDPDEVAFLLYTSGTTGVPKGVMLTHANLAYVRPLGADFWRFGPDSVNLIAMPMFHIGGIAYALITPAHGGHIVLLRDAEPTGVIEAIQAHRVTHAFFVPAAIQAIISSPAATTADFSSLELIGYGASPIGDALLRRALTVLGCDFTQAYGMTETAGTVVTLPSEDHEPDGPRSHLLRSCGKPLPWHDVALFDPAAGKEVKPGEVGEIWVRSYQNTKGYRNNAKATAETITPEGWLRTGDAAYRDEDGYFYLYDRFKDMIVSGGENVYPAEVENVLSDHPDVVEVAVVGVPHERWGETVKAIVVARPGADPTPAELIEFARQRLGRYKCPTSVDFTDVLPRNASGKILKKDLRAPYWKDHDRFVG